MLFGEEPEETKVLYATEKLVYQELLAPENCSEDVEIHLEITEKISSGAAQDEYNEYEPGDPDLEIVENQSLATEIMAEKAKCGYLNGSPYDCCISTIIAVFGVYYIWIEFIGSSIEENQAWGPPITLAKAQIAKLPEKLNDGKTSGFIYFICLSAFISFFIIEKKIL